MAIVGEDYVPVIKGSGLTGKLVKPKKKKKGSFTTNV